MSESKKILIIEDNKDITMLLRQRLQSEGFSKIECAADGVQAIRSAQHFQPDLVLLDVLMPGWDGLNVLKRIKMSTRTQNIPIIVVSGMKDELKKKEILAQGIRGYFQKPCDFGELMFAIREALTPPS